MSTASEALSPPACHDLIRNYQRLGTVEAIRLSFQNHLRYTLAKD